VRRREGGKEGGREEGKRLAYPLPSLDNTHKLTSTHILSLSLSLSYRADVDSCASALAAEGPLFIEPLLWLYRSHGTSLPPSLPPSFAPSSPTSSTHPSLPASLPQTCTHTLLHGEEAREGLVTSPSKTNHSHPPTPSFPPSFPPSLSPSDLHAQVLSLLAEDRCVARKRGKAGGPSPKNRLLTPTPPCLPPPPSLPPYLRSARTSSCSSHRRQMRGEGAREGLVPLPIPSLGSRLPHFPLARPPSLPPSLGPALPPSLLLPCPCSSSSSSGEESEAGVRGVGGKGGREGGREGGKEG